MKTPTDIEIAQQLEQLAQVIEKGTHAAQAVLTQVEQVRGEVNAEITHFTNLREELLELCHAAQTSATNMEKAQLECQDNLNTVQGLNQNIEKYISQINQYENLISQLRQEISNFNSSLTSSHQQLDNLQANIQELDRTLPQQFDRISHIYTQLRTDKQQLQELTQTSQTQIAKAEEVNLEFQQILSQIENIYTQLGGREGVDKLNQEWQNNHKNWQNTDLAIERLNQKLEAQIKKQKSLFTFGIIIAIGVVVSILLAVVN